MQDVGDGAVRGRGLRLAEARAHAGERSREPDGPRRDRDRVAAAGARRADGCAVAGGRVVGAGLEALGADEEGAEVRLLDEDDGDHEDETPSQHRGGEGSAWRAGGPSAGDGRSSLLSP